MHSQASQVKQRLALRQMFTDFRLHWIDALNNLSGGGPRGAGPHGVPVESALRVSVLPRRKEKEPPLPPL